jgi:hypothetical protein
MEWAPLEPPLGQASHLISYVRRALVNLFGGKHSSFFIAKIFAVKSVKYVNLLNKLELNLSIGKMLFEH